ncbi:protein artichoke-like [Saccostrea echinata]|uniref:protein artichoke-like n=1 Tax=Saccostrea echinata TaxID=191078 RepID=UPI002A819193|nr:protein artichoke-like [Saccostrea echinata]
MSLPFLGILIGMANACPEACKCLDKTLNCSYRELSEQPVIDEAFQKWNFSGNQLKRGTTAELRHSVTSVVNILDISYNKVTIVEENFLLNFENLQEVSVSNNKLNDFGFSLPSTLEILKASNNFFQTWPIDKLLQPHNLREVYFDHNFLKSVTCSKDTNLIFERFEKLDLSFNNIENLDDCIFKKMPVLHNLNLSNNKIKKLTEELFKSNTQLEKLDLSGNMLKHIPKGLFEKVPNLSYLFLSRNKIVTFPSQLPTLEVLDISFNLIHSVEEDIKGDVYPHEVLLLGGNPFYCDCRVQWLKEFLDTREYQLQYYNIPEEKFIPTCQGPSNLFNDSWNYLSSDLFVCDFENPQEEKGLEDSEIKQKDLKLKTVEIGETFVKLHWNIYKTVSVTSLSYELKYHQFGHKDKQTLHSFRSTSLSYVLQNLTAGTAYIICLREVTSIQKTEFDCVEIVTKEDSLLYAYMFFICVLSVLFYVFKV